MTNDELKKKICDIVAPYVSAYGDDEAIVHALIAAGIEIKRPVDPTYDELLSQVNKLSREEQEQRARAEKAERRAVKARWLWDDEDDAPKCSCCGGRAMYQPHQKGNGEKLCFITLSLYCPHCGAKMEDETCEEDTEEYREQAEKELAEERKDD